jgi:hypothetical protein
MRKSIVLMIGAFLLAGSSSRAQDHPCGTRTSDWCPAPAGDPCGRHRNTAECKADAACYGMRYRGESVIACILDARGFASNCPTVGCTSMRPAGPPPPK